MTEITIGNRKVGPGHPPFIIAEMSGNHNQSLDRALKIVDAAADSGAHALKLQTYTPDTMTLDLSEGEFFIEDKNSLWKGTSLYNLYKEAMTPWEWHQPIFERCQERGLIFLSTPFDASSVDFLEDFRLPVYKIASFENGDIPLIKKVAATGKPLIISTGMASLTELEDMVSATKSSGCKELILLKCTSAYPSPASAINLKTIPHLRELFNVHVGLSDHTMGIGVALAAVALGANVIEKHFTLKRSDGGVDSAFSLEPEELKELAVESQKVFEALGKVHYGITEKETSSRQFRRSIYICEDIGPNETLTEKNLRCIRPGHGLGPKYYEQLLGKKVKVAVKKGTPMSFDFL